MRQREEVRRPEQRLSIVIVMEFFCSSSVFSKEGSVVTRQNRAMCLQSREDFQVFVSVCRFPCV